MSNPWALPTVQVQHPSGEGYIVINESDFDPALHKLYSPEPPEKEVQQSELPETQTSESLEVSTDLPPELKRKRAIK